MVKGPPARNKKLKEVRQAAVQEPPARPGASLRSVGAEVGMQHGSVEDLAKGYSGGGKRRPKAEEASSGG